MTLGVSDAAAKREVPHQESGFRHTEPQMCYGSLSEMFRNAVPFANVKCTVTVCSAWFIKVVNMDVLSHLGDL